MASNVIYLRGSELDNCLRQGQCDIIIANWELWSRRKFGATCPPAMLDATSDYMALGAINAKTRNMVRKSWKAGYEFRFYDYNDYLDDMHEINTSMEVRGGRKMAPSYWDKLEPISSQSDECPCHTTLYVSAVKDDKLMAYCQLGICGDLAIINRILGHRDALPDGVMNGLVAFISGAAWLSGCKWVNYLTMASATSGLEAFKRHAGFRSLEDFSFTTGGATQ